MICAVTGGNGFLGREVVEKLLKAGHQVRVLSRSGGDSSENLIQHKGSVENQQALESFLEGSDVLLHLAGQVSRDPKDNLALQKIHVQGTQNTFQAALKHKIKRIILASTSGTIGVNNTGATVFDDDEYALGIVKSWPYYLSKIYQEKYALHFAEENNMELISLRPTLLLGPNDKDRSSTKDVENFLLGKIASRLNGGISFVDVRDVADVFVEATQLSEIPSDEKNASKRKRQRTYLLGGANMSLDEFFDLISTISGISTPKFKMNTDLAKMGSKVWSKMPSFVKNMYDIDSVNIDMATHYWYIDSSRAKKELKFHPRNANETISDTVKYLMSKI